MYTYNEVVHELYKSTYKSTKRKKSAIIAGIKRDPKERRKHRGEK